MTVFLKKGKLTGTVGVGLKQKPAGSTVARGLLLHLVGAGLGGGGGTPPPAPEGVIGLFNDTVPAGHNSSSGWLETPDKTYIGPLWNNRKEVVSSSATTRTSHVDGRAYDLSPVKAGAYVVKVATHAFKTEFEGGIGNPSLDLADMDGMHRGYQFMRQTLEVGDYEYANQHYVEGPSPLIKYLKSNPQKAIQVFPVGTNSGCTFEYMAADATRLYMAVYDRLGSNVVTYVQAITTSNDQFYAFSAGGSYKAQHGSRTDSTLGLLTTNDANNIITGLAVQQTGSFLVKTHDLSNKLYVHHKLTGALLQTVTTITRPRACAIDNQDRLWLVSGTNTVSCYTFGADGSLTPAGLSLSGLVAPFGVASRNALVYVTDHGSSQQVKAYDVATGAPQWVRGQLGGQMATPTVSVDRFYFSDASLSVDWSSIGTRANGQYSVVEPGNNRVQVFNADGTAVGGALGLISYRTNSYECGMDKNDRTRLFWNYQEFKVDYSKPVKDCWTLVRNWRASAPANHFISTNEQQNVELGAVFRSVYTDPLNGRTYATCQRPTDGVFVEVELAATGLRVVRTDTAPFALGADGSVNFSRFNNTNGYDWSVKARTGFDASGNRQMAASAVVAGIATVADSEPYDHSGYPNECADVRTDSGYRVLYQTGLVRKLYGKVFGLGWHLGLVKEGARKWDKLLNFATGDQEYAGGQSTEGYYNTGDHLYANDARPDLAPGDQVGYGGAGVKATGEWLVEKVYGEFYRGGQQNESFLWHAASGAMVHAYGVNSDEVSAWQAATGKRVYPGMSGGVHRHEICVSPVDSNVLYEWHGEEGGSGTLNRYATTGLNTWAVQVAKEFVVTGTSTFAPAYPAGTVNLLAKAPKRGSIAGTSGCGWKQSKPDDYSNKFGGGPYWTARFGIRTYNPFNTPGVEFRQRGTNTSTSWLSDAFATGATGNNWELLCRERYEDNSPNNGELGTANSGGMYRHLRDSSGKVLVRSYLKDLGNNVVAVMANGKTLASGPAGPLTAMWRRQRTYQDWRIKNVNGTVSIQYADFPAVTLPTPFESGGDFTRPGTLEYLAWESGTSSRDRVTALEMTYFIPSIS